MRIAVAAMDNDAAAEVSAHSGRAPYFLIFDEKADLLDALPNPYALAERGAGQRAAALLVDEEIDLFIGGRFGPMLREHLANHGIRCIEKRGRAQDAVREVIHTSHS